MRVLQTRQPQRRRPTGSVQRPLSPACITVAVPRPLWKERPGWFLIAEQDRMIVVENQRFMAARMGARVHSHAVDHAPMVTAPVVVLDVLREAIEAVRGESAAQFLACFNNR